MYGYIYKTTCLVNNLIYVGQHKAVKFMGRRYLGSGKLLKQDIKKFGRSNFICELLDTAETINELNEKEIFWISELNATDPAIGYNRDPGGYMLDLKNHILAKGYEYLKVMSEDVATYIEQGWIELFISSQQQDYDTKVKNGSQVVKPRTYSEEQLERKRQADHEHYLANKEKYIERARLWQQQNRDKVKDWAEANKERINAKDRERYHNDPEFRAKALEAGRKYRTKHRDEINKKQRENYKKRK